MSALSSVNVPTFSYQIDPLLNISPLIDLHSNCLTHVVDTDNVFLISAHKSPIIASHAWAILKSNLPYQLGFTGVRYSRCLLTIASFFSSWKYNLLTLMQFMMPSKFHQFEPISTQTTNFLRIYPQTFIVLTNKIASFIELRNNLDEGLVDNVPLVFALRLTKDTDSFPRIFGENVHQDTNLTFSCSTLESCGVKVKLTIPKVAEFMRGTWKFIGSAGSTKGSSGGNPFERAGQAGIEEAIDSFILGPHSQRILTAGSHPLISHIPPPTYTERLKEQIKLGQTATVKFVTAIGVLTPKTSYHVFFSPFMPKVWLGILISAGITLLALIGAYRMQRAHEAQVGLVSLTAQLTTWMLTAAIGQYPHSGIPMISGQFCRVVVSTVSPVVVSWFLFSTFIINVYSAIFSSDATRSFYYSTNYTEFFQLPYNMTTYILVNESYVERYQVGRLTKGCTVETFGARSFCRFQQFAPPACSIFRNAQFTFSRWKRQKHRQEDYRKLNNIWFNGKFLRANVNCISRILLESQKPPVFLISAHDFYKYWKLFVQVMQSNPDIKLANNFDSDEPFLSEPVVFEFTGGLHQAFKGSAMARLKILSSSGIYGLWNKWHRIRFTDGGLQQDEMKLEQENKVNPLSFENSGTSWVFQAQAIAWLLSTCLFMGEILLRAATAWSLKL